MTYGEKPEALITPQTANRLKEAILELRVQDGLLLDSVPMHVQHEPGLEMMCVGETDNGSYLVLSNDAAAEGPFVRDVFLFREAAQRLFRVTLELDSYEIGIVETFKQAVNTWHEAVAELDPLEQAEEITRFQTDSLGFSESMDTYKEIVDLGRYGDIAEEEVEQRLAGVKLGYTAYETDDPEQREYELKYVACAKATMDYQSLIVDIDQRLDVVTSDLLENPDTTLTSLEMPFTEARAWNLLALLDRVQSSARQ